MDKSHSTFYGSLINKILLLGILVTLILILLKMPAPLPTVGEFKALKKISSFEEQNKQRHYLKNRMPAIEIKGGQLDSIYDTVKVDLKYIQGNTPWLEVHIANEPITVKVDR